MIVCWKNLYHTQELQNRAHDKEVKPWSYTSGKKVWLNSKYIETKHNQKLETKFFGRFRVLYPIGKQVYKLELPKKWGIHDIFHLSLLKQDTIRKGWVDDENATELDIGNNKSGNYKVEAIRDNAIYVRESKTGHLPGFYYLVSWKGNPKEEITWELTSAVQHLRKLICSFYKDHLNKPTAMFSAINTASLMARPIIKLTKPLKQK